MKRFFQITVAACTALILVASEGALAVDSSKISQKAPKAIAPAVNTFAPTSPNASPASLWPSSNPTNEARPTARTYPSEGLSRVAPSYLPPQDEVSIAHPKWRLGFYPKSADVGVGVARIIPGSAAQRGGLEEGDLIVAVAGHQVGYLDGVFYDTSKEFEEHADPNGWVTLLVQDNRSGRLLALPIQLDGQRARIQGNITYRERYALPANAVTTVELRELLRPGAPPIVLARETMQPARNVPIPFSINYDPSQIDHRRTYVLHATIAIGDRILFITRNDVRVLSGGASGPVELLVESATAYPSGPGGGPTPTSQIDQVAQWFREYLHRDPRESELYVWKAHLDRGGSMYDAQLQLLSTPEFYYQSNANDRQYITRMYEVVNGQRPSQDQVNYWLNRLAYHNQLRSEVVREFLADTRTTRR